MAVEGRAGQKVELAGGLRGERTHRELRLSRGPVLAQKKESENATQYECVIPGVLHAPELGCRIRIEAVAASEKADRLNLRAVLRPWKPGDRVRLRYSSGPRKVKEVLERMKVSGEDRVHWPVVEVAGRIVWMRGVEVEPDGMVQVFAETIDDGKQGG